MFLIVNETFFNFSEYDIWHTSEQSTLASCIEETNNDLDTCINLNALNDLLAFNMADRIAESNKGKPPAFRTKHNYGSINVCLFLFLLMKVAHKLI